MLLFKLEQTPSVASHRVLSPLYSTRKMSRSAFSHVLGHHKCMPGTRFNTGMQQCHPAPYPADAENSDVRRSSNMFWLVVYLPLWKIWVVSWDDDIPNWMESHKIPWFRSTNQHSLTMVISTYIYRKHRIQPFIGSSHHEPLFQDELTGPSPFTSPRSGLPGMQ